MIHRQQKKVLSSSFSKESKATIPQQKSGSFSADKLTSFKAEQKGAQKSILVKVIQSLNSNKQKSLQAQWKIISFEQKRVMAGFKGFIEWCNRVKDIKIVFKISIASSYFRLINHLNGGDIFVQIKQLNFALTTQQQKQLQENIEKILATSIEITNGKNFNDEIKKQSQCLKLFFNQANNYIQKKMYQGKKKCSQKIDPNLSKKLMLYPAPAAFAWNPLGSICITQNKYPNYKKTFSGDANSLKKYFETSRHEAVMNLGEEDNNLKLNSQLSSYETIYDWKIEEQIELIIFNKQKSKKQDRFYVNRAKDQLESQSKKQEQKNDQEGIILVSLNRLSSIKLRKLYERYFRVGQHTNQFNRHDKLRVYDVRSYNRDHQDDIIYIIQKLGMAEDNNKLSSLFANDVSAYPHFLEQINNLKYKLLGGILRTNLSNPKLQFCTYLKIFILQNEFIGKQIEKYFKQMYKVINRMPHHLLYFMGSYNHFDNIKAQLFFMDLLQKTIELNEVAGTQVSDLYNDMTLKLRKKMKLPKLNYESLLSQTEKNNFFTKLFPILIVKDRQMEKFQFKQIKRIITANSKIFLFIKKMNQILSKLEEGKIGFIKSLIQTYIKFREIQVHSNSVNFQPRVFFYVHCRYCHMATKIYQLDTKQYLQFCGKCKQKLMIQ